MHTAQNINANMNTAIVGISMLGVVKLLLWFFFLAIWGLPWSLEALRIIAGAFN